MAQTKLQAFGIIAEFRVISVLRGKEIQRFPIIWADCNKVVCKLKLPNTKINIDAMVWDDLMSTILVEPTSQELEFRRDKAVEPSTARHMLLHCSNVWQCNFKYVVRTRLNEATGGFELTQAGGLQDKCPKCGSILYSCGKSVLARTVEINGEVRCKCILDFQKIGFHIPVPTLEKSKLRPASDIGLGAPVKVDPIIL